MSGDEAPASHHANIRVERTEHVATVTLDRPQSKNACTGEMWVALGATFRELSYSGVRAIVLTGANGDFCTGADLGGSGRSSGDDGSGRMATMTDDMREALMAYMERRPPTFQGR
jgi:enoyl-CoA hydratase/carnithine racemase